MEPVRVVVQDLHVLKLAVQVEGHAGGSSGAVVGESQVMPLVQGHRGVRADLDGIVRPGMNQVRHEQGPAIFGTFVLLEVAHEKVVAAETVQIIHPGDDGLVSLVPEPDPGQ